MIIGLEYFASERFVKAGNHGPGALMDRANKWGMYMRGRKKGMTNDWALPPDLGAPVSPSAILIAVVVMVRRAGTLDVLRVWMRELRIIFS